MFFIYTNIIEEKKLTINKRGTDSMMYEMKICLNYVGGIHIGAPHGL
jgi:hypothetical protein